MGLSLSHLFIVISLPLGALFFLLLRSSTHAATKFSILLLIISVGAIGWGVWYRGNHQFLAASAVFGVDDTTYTMAGWAAGLGLLAFLIGLALLVAGIVRGGRQTP